MQHVIEIIEKVKALGSQIYIVKNFLKTIPVIKDSELLESISKYEADIRFYLKKKWTEEPDLKEILRLPVEHIKDLPLPPIIEIEIAGFGNVYFDFTDKANECNPYRNGIVFSNNDIDCLVECYYNNELNPSVMINTCNKKKINKLKSIRKNNLPLLLIAFDLFLLSITAKPVSINIL
jgi:hypothetical protein